MLQLENSLLGCELNGVSTLRRLHGGGGFFERLVGSVKRCLRKVMGQRRLTYDELLTVLTEVEARH